MSFKSKFINTLLSFTGSGVPSVITDPDREGLLIKAALLSDTHLIDDYESSAPVMKAVKNIDGSAPHYDVLAITGDCTHRGRRNQYDILSYILYSAKNIGNILPVMGNHDTGLGKDHTDGYEANKNRFMNMLNLFADCEKPYYSVEINGCTFIALAPESDIYEDNQFMNESQLEWFEHEITQAEKKKTPVFVLNHYALNGTHHIDVIWPEGALGERSDRVKEILSNHSSVPVFYITGHIHNYFDVSGISEYCGFYIVDLPCFCKGNIYFDKSDTEMKTQLRKDEKGLGYQMFVYKDKVLFRAVNFITNEQYPQFNKEIIFQEDN